MSWFRPGEIIDGRYELGPMLGEGGFGVVYKAKQISTGQPVAVKFILEERLGSAQTAWVELARFEREMQTIAKLRHPNVVRLIDSGTAQDKHLYIVLEYIEGETLSMALRRGPLPPSEAGQVMFQVLDALSAAHQLGIIHRDLKPQNVMLTSGGFRRHAMVLDFGVAGILKHARDMHYVSLTNDSEIRGTPAYMAPEQLQQGPLTPQTDLYSWGLVFIEVLTGQPAVQGENAFEIALRQADDAPIDVPDELDPGLRKILKKAVAKSLTERYSSAAEGLLDLQKWVANAANNPAMASMEMAETAEHASAQIMASVLRNKSEVDKSDQVVPIPNPTAREPESEGESGSRRPAALVLLALVLVAAGAIGAWFMLREEEPEPSNEETAQCSLNSDCGDGMICGPAGDCADWKSDACSVVEGPVGADDTLVIGAISPTDRNSYLPREQAMRLAIKEVNDAGGMPGGQKLVLISCNDAGLRSQGLDAARHLVNDLGAVAVVGPAWSSIFVDVVTGVTREAGVVTVSHAATSPFISTLPDDGLAWRTVPSDRAQATAIAELVKRRNDTSVVVIAKSDAYGTGLLNAIGQSLLSYLPNGLVPVTYPEVNPDFPLVVGKAIKPDVRTVIILGTAESAELVKLYEEEAARRNYSPPHYILSESGRRPDVVALARENPSLYGRIEVVGPSDRNEPHYSAFELRMEARFGPLPDVGKVANAYDAVYAIALAASAIPPEEAVTGSAIAARFARLVEGEPTPVGPGVIGAVQRRLQSGASIDLEGASGQLNFDLATGDVTASTILWRLSESVDGPVYVELGRFDGEQWHIPPDVQMVTGDRPLVLTRIPTMLLELGWSRDELEDLQSLDEDAEGLRIGWAAPDQRTERIPAFKLAMHEVTWAQWQRYDGAATAAEVCEAPLPEPGEPLAAVDGIGGAEAEAFCQSLGLRLPTADEMEAAMRGPTGRPLAFAGELTEERKGILRSQQKAMSVSWNATEHLTYDLSGGVAEWVTCSEGRHCENGFGLMGGSAGGSVVWWRAGLLEPLDDDADPACLRRPEVGFRCADDME